MGVLLRLVLGLAGGPAGWLASAISIVKTVVAWCLKHWKIVAAALALAWAFAYGWHWRGERDANKIAEVKQDFAQYKKGVEEKEATRAAQQAVFDAEREKNQQDEKDANDKAEKKTQAVIADLTKKNAWLEEGLNGYVAEHSKPTPAGSCPTDTDIGADGVQLINAAIEAGNRARSGEGDAVGHDAVQAGDAGTRKQ